MGAAKCHANEQNITVTITEMKVRAAPCLCSKNIFSGPELNEGGLAGQQTEQ